MTSSFLSSRDLISQKQMSQSISQYPKLRCLNCNVDFRREGGSALPTQLHRSGSRTELVIRLNALAVTITYMFPYMQHTRNQLLNEMPLCDYLNTL